MQKTDITTDAIILGMREHPENGVVFDSERKDTPQWDGNPLTRGRTLAAVPDLDATLGLLDEAREARKARLAETFPNVAPKSIDELGKIPGLDNVTDLQRVRDGLQTEQQRKLFDAMNNHPAGGRNIDGPELA